MSPGEHHQSGSSGTQNGLAPQRGAITDPATRALHGPPRGVEAVTRSDADVGTTDPGANGYVTLFDRRETLVLTVSRIDARRRIATDRGGPRWLRYTPDW